MKLTSAFLPLLCLAMAAPTPLNAKDRGPIVLTDQARQIHAKTPVADGHNDLPWEIRTKGDSNLDRLDIGQLQPSLQTDIPRMKEGGVGIQFWSVWVPVSTARRGTALLTTLEQIDLVKQMVRRYPQDLRLALTTDDINQCLTDGKIASLIGVEGGHCIEGSLATLHQLYERGARYMTLTHSDSLDWADSATDDSRAGGLSEFGKEVIREMNRLGMMVDISHVSAETMHQTLDTTAAPVIFSHSSCRAVANHPRNVPDDVLERMPKNGGVVMINFFSGFVVPEASDVYTKKFNLRKKLEQELNDDDEAIKRRLEELTGDKPMPTGTIHDVLDHIDHAVKVAGIDHVGIGSDYDGVSVLPKQLEDVSCYPYLTQGMLDRGYTEEQIAKVLSGNILRVMKAVEEKAADN
ncbi:Membrane dipeptidase (Peptidase family M19) [Posidoniimonas polymericola]|uniref:Membrane dipeptidase (Peptidase family M19) n=1 Tax=Posidoniimonas polymericola TaxID=2528002 RepID=A0A5C5YTU0_9BACT|nr:dipeptidase [Posidoniimonas polymericola]TWT78424.1 Membrane dipeptidase (Peptidase family M19) [Posidoniimonas polymericola]